jgi:hypothetical protein
MVLGVSRGVRRLIGIARGVHAIAKQITGFNILYVCI